MTSESSLSAIAVAVPRDSGLFEQSYASSQVTEEFSAYVPLDVLAEALEAQSGYDRFDDLVTFNMSGEIPAGALAAFEKLAQALRLPVVQDYGTLKIQREKDYERRRHSALNSIWHSVRELWLEMPPAEFEFDASGIPLQLTTQLGT